MEKKTAQNEDGVMMFGGFRVWSKKSNSYLPKDSVVMLPNGQLMGVGFLGKGAGIELFKLDMTDHIKEGCTSFKDKNGKLVHQGDIVQVKAMNHEVKHYLCEWREPYNGYLFQEGNSSYGMTWSEITFHTDSY